MKTCDFCGNPVKKEALICPYCTQPLSIIKIKSAFKIKKAAIINIEAGLPLVKEALLNFDRELKFAQSQDVGILKIIHGYGSSGTGGKIKIALRQKLKLLLANNIIKGIIAGEVYSKASNSTINNRKITECYPDLLETLHSDKYNPGITFVEL
jgi:hypothetical protein